MSTFPRDAFLDALFKSYLIENNCWNDQIRWSKFGEGFGIPYILISTYYCSFYEMSKTSVYSFGKYDATYKYTDTRENLEYLLKIHHSKSSYIHVTLNYNWIMNGPTPTPLNIGTWKFQSVYAKFGHVIGKA